MLAKRIIPCLDVKDGMTVKGVNFVNLRSAGDPVELGKRYSDEGADELVYLDITASYEHRKTFIADVDRLLSNGADKVSVNSAALNRPQLIDEIARQFGRQVCVVAIDARFTDGQWVCYEKGGRVKTGRTLYEWAHEAQERGAGEILFTSMDHDGTKNGYACDALRQLHQQLQIPIIASGGCGNASHIADAFKTGLADAALAASVFHFGEIQIPTLKQHLHTLGIPVRL